MNKRYLKLRNAILALLLVMNIPAMAQQTGSFSTSITFAGQPRTLAFYVPTNYDPANSYSLMICLHGLGDNANNYRNALINSLQLQTFMPNTIIVCPDGGSDQIKDFYTPAGDEAIIDSTISYAAGIYNINTNDMILQGFSLGGRSALRYGLDRPAMFKGLMLHTPAVQGVKEAVNQAGFNYANASQVPIYITHGGQDITYTSPIDSTYEQLILNDGIVRLERFPALGHSIPPFSQIPGFTTWIYNPAANALDLEVARIKAPARQCVANLSIPVLVRNAAATPITSVEFEYKAGTITQTHTWTGNLAAFEHAMVSLPAITTAPGSQNLTVKVIGLNGGLADTITANNEQTEPYIYASQAVPLPFLEGFETTTFPPQGWVLQRSGDFYSAWEYDDLVMNSGTGSVFAFNTILIFDNAGRREELLSPVVDLTSHPNPGISFDVAYAFHRFIPPVATDTVDFADTLEIYVSTDCGDSYQRVFKKGGQELLTFSQPILNPLNINDTWAMPAASDWRNEQVDLSSFAGSSQAIVKFSYVSALGGAINIDNIRFHSPLSVEGTFKTRFEIYPNPAKDKVVVDAGNDMIREVTVTDVTGRTVVNEKAGAAQHNVTVNTASLPAGYYLFRTLTSSGIHTDKVLIQR